MLKIFRNIRRKLIDHSNLRRYLFYAIGEIFLVMIGILLALQVNNWNQGKKEASIKDTYLMALSEDAKKDLKRLERFLINAENYIQKAEENYINKYPSSSYKITKGDLDKIGMLRQTFFISEGTFQEIISNGHLSLLPEKVKKELLELHTMFKSINKIDDNMAQVINEQHIKMGEYFEIFRQNQTNQFLVKSVPNVYENQAMLTYKNYININYDWMKTQSYFYNQLKEQYIQLIGSMEENRQTQTAND